MHTTSNPTSQVSDSTERDRLPQIAYAPILQKTLDGIDTNLDEELDRYRHWQENGQTFSYLNPFKSSLGIGALQSNYTASRTNLGAIASPANKESAGIQLPKMPSPLPQTREVSQDLLSQELPSQELPLSPVQSPPESSIKAAPAQPILAENFATNSSDRPDIQSNVQVDWTNLDVSNLLEQMAATTLDEPETSSTEIDEEDLSPAITDSYANDEEFDSNYLEDEYEEEEEDSPGFNIFSHLGIAALLLLLTASSVIGYSILDPNGIAKLFKPGQVNSSQPATSSAPDSNESDINPKQERNPVDRDTLTDPQKNPKLVPFAPLPGKLPQPGQSVKGFTTNTPNQPSKQLSNPSDRSSDRPSVPKLSVPPLPNAKTARLASPTALPPAILPYQPEAIPPALPAHKTYTPPVRDTYTPPVRDTYVPPARDTYTPPSHPAPVYKSAPESHPQVNTTTPAATHPRWKRPNNALPAAISPTKNLASSHPTSTDLPPLPKSPTTAALTAPARDSVPVRYTAPISAAPRDPVLELPAKPASTGYKVIAPTSYLPKAQEVDKNAFVRPSGEVQLGAYQNPKAAQQRADELRRQGIPVQVQQQ